MDFNVSSDAIQDAGYTECMTRRDLCALAPALLLSGCSTAPEPKVEKKPVEPVTGLHALYAMYGKARLWAPDIKILRLSSINIAKVKSQPGKAPAWQAVFASESLGQKRAYTYSVIDASTTLREGTFADSPGAWSNDHRAFLIAAVRADTDKAWETALKHGADYAKKYPDMPIFYLLELGRRVNAPMWRVVWGESVTSSALSILVDAESGSYLETLH
jgi:hypothetical protein